MLDDRSPIVVDHPEMFDDVAEPPVVERATARPGEKRTTKARS